MIYQCKFRFTWLQQLTLQANTKASEVLSPNPAETANQLKPLCISYSGKDGLISFTQAIHKYCITNNVPHIWNVEPGVSNFKVWKNDQFRFAQLIFKP